MARQYNGAAECMALGKTIGMIKRYLATLILAVLAGTGIFLSPLLAAAGMILGVFVSSFLMFPAAVTMTLLIVRSSMDIFTTVGFYAGPLLFNVPSLISLLILVGGGSYIFFEITIRKEMFLGKLGQVFLLWIVSLLPWVAIAYANFELTGGLVAFREWIRLASLFMIYLLTFKLAARIGYSKAISYLFLALPGPLIVGAYQFLSAAHFNSANRISATFDHPNQFALFLVFFIGLTLWKIKTAIRKKFWIFLLTIECFFLIVTFSVGGLIMLIIMLAMVALKTGTIKRRVSILLLISVVTASFALSDFGKKRLEEVYRIGSYKDIVQTGRISGGGSFAWRILNWSLLVKEWRHKPVLGYGLRTSAEKVNPFYNEAHNDYLRFLVETGLIGCSCCSINCEADF